MNYFELLSLPIHLSVDKKLLTRNYKKKVSQHEKDGTTGGNQPQDVLLNTAYKTLLNQDETIRYVLQLKSLMHEDEKYETDPEFLLEVNEINQALSELIEGDEDKIEEIETAIKEQLKKSYADVEHIIEHYKEGAVTEKELLQVKEYYYRKKLLQRVLDKVAQLRNIAAL